MCMRAAKALASLRIYIRTGSSEPSFEYAGPLKQNCETIIVGQPLPPSPIPSFGNLRIKYAFDLNARISPEWFWSRLQFENRLESLTIFFKKLFICLLCLIHTHTQNIINYALVRFQ